MKNIIKYTVTFIVLIVIYFGLLYVTSLIPSSKLKENVRESAEYLVKLGEVEHVKFVVRRVTLFQFTNSLMINTAYSIDSNNPIDSMLTARKNYNPEKTKIIIEETPNDLQSAKKYYKDGIITTDAYQSQELYDLVNDKDVGESFEYARYWHGYLTYLRLLLLFFNYKQINIMSLIIFISLLGANLYFICKKLGFKYMIALFIAYLATDGFVVSKSLNEITCIIISLILNLIILNKKEIKHLGYFFFVIGSIVNFVDFLTLPLLTYGFPILIYILLIEKEKRLNSKETLVLFFKTGMAWSLGYILTWISKWIIIDLLLNKKCIKNAIDQVLYRTIGTSHTEDGYSKIVVDFLSMYTLIIVYTMIYISMLLIKKIKKLENYEIYKNIFAIPLVFYFIIIGTNVVVFLMKQYVTLDNAFANSLIEIVYKYTENGGIGIVKQIGFILIKPAIVILNLIMIKDMFEIKEAKDIIKLRLVLPYILGLSLPFLWFIVLRNHSIIHSFFSCRNLAIAVFSFELIFIEGKKKIEEDKEINEEIENTEKILN